MDEQRHPRHAASSRSGARRAQGALLDSAGGAARTARVRSRDEHPSAADRAAREQEARSELRTRLVRGVALVLIVAAAVAVLVVGLRACGLTGAIDGLEGGDDGPDVLEPAYESPYDWSSLSRNGDRWSYVLDGTVRSRIGIDVSESQLWIDWPSVAADGIDFAMIRAGYRGATEGQLYTDEYFAYNLAGARDAGLECGVYFFSQAISTAEAIEEADYVLSLLDGAPLAYPIAFDSEEAAVVGVESRIAGLSRDEMTAIAEAFCTRVAEAGYESMVYGNAYDVSRYDAERLASDAVWWAEYDVASPSPHLDICMWQYANSGQVAGIETAVDMNIDLRDVLAELKRDSA